MGCFFKLRGFQHLVLFSLLCTFPLAVLTPLPVYGYMNVDFNRQAEFELKIQESINRAWKCYDNSDSDGFMDVIWEIKSEVEDYTGNKIDLIKEINRIEIELENLDVKLDKDTFVKFKRLIQRKNTEKQQRDFYGEHFFIQGSRLVVPHKHYHEEQEEISLKVAVGISLVLCGGFVMFATPVCPVFGLAGETITSIGLGLLVDQGLEIYQKKY